MGEAFEYKIYHAQRVALGAEEEWDYENWHAIWNEKNVELFMSKLSKNRWELVSVSPSNLSSFGVLVFKRLKLDL